MEPYARADFDHDRIPWLDFDTCFIENSVVKSDQAFMANFVETAFPLMNRRLAEFVVQIPGLLRLKGFRRPSLQKRAMEAHLQSGILARRNVGLELPRAGWSLGGPHPIAEQWLSGEAVERTGILDVDTVRRLWREHESRRRELRCTLGSIVNGNAWYALFPEPGTFREHRAA